MAGIAAIGVEIPQGRLSRATLGEAWGTPSARGRRSVAAADQDALTLATEAGRAALAGYRGEAPPDSLVLATTSSPFAAKAAASIVGTALRLGDDVRTIELGGSPRCGVDALRVAADAVDAGSARAVLVVVGECPPSRPGSSEEHRNGDAAVGFVVDAEGALASFDAWGTLSEDLTSRWRLSTDRVPREFEPKLEAQRGLGCTLPEAIRRALAAAGLAGDAVAAAVVPGPDGRPGTAAAKAAGIRAEVVAASLLADIGDAGAAAPLLGLARALSSAGPRERILFAGHGDGATAAVVTRGDEAVEDLVGAALARSREVGAYEQYVSGRGLLEEGGTGDDLEVSPVAYWRRRRAILARQGARCEACGTAQFPPAPACSECGSPGLVPFDLGDLGVVYTFTNDHLVNGSYMDTPLARCVVDLDGGGRFYTTMTDCDPSEVRVGMPVELTFRARSRGGFRNYGWKCRPLEVTT